MPFLWRFGMISYWILEHLPEPKNETGLRWRIGVALAHFYDWGLGSHFELDEKYQIGSWKALEEL